MSDPSVTLIADAPRNFTEESQTADITDMGKASARPSPMVLPNANPASAQRRRHERVPVVGEVRLWLDGWTGTAAIKGHILDLSAGGCSLLLRLRPDAGDLGRVQLSVDGRSVWLPIEIRWVRADEGGWVAGAAFDRPTPEKQDLIRALIRQRQRLL